MKQSISMQNQIEKLVDALYRLPITEETPAVFNSPLVPIEEIMPKVKKK